MGLYTLLTTKAVDAEESENGKLEIATIGPIGFGKKI
jgi:hypothetical protein